MSTRAFIPIEVEIGDAELPASELVRWYVLIRDAEDVRRVTGMGLASVWRWIHQCNYAAARAEMDRVLAYIGWRS